MDLVTLGAAVAMSKGNLDKVVAPVTAADAGKIATVDSNGKYTAAALTVGQGEVAVDSTLLVSGAAADAKKTGDEVSALKSAINAIEDDSKIYAHVFKPEFEQGAVQVVDYVVSDVEATNIVRTTSLEGVMYTKGTTIRLLDKDTFDFRYKYKDTGGKWYAQDWRTSDLEFAGDRKVIIEIKRKNWTALAPEDCVGVIEFLYITQKIDRDYLAYYKTFSVADALKYPGMFWEFGNGIAANSASSKISAFIPIMSGMQISYDLSTSGGTKYALMYYNKDFDFVSGSKDNVHTFTAANDGYVRFCCINDYAGRVSFEYAIPDKIQNEIDAINQTLTDDVTGTNYMQTALTRITGELKAKSVLGNIVTFGFSTDQHIKDEDDATLTLPVLRGLTVLSRLTQAYPYDFVCLGGDACEGGSYATTLARILDECVTVQKPLHDAWCPVVPLTGNHDAAQNNANITGGMMFNVHFKRIANSGFLEGWDNTHTNGYWDSEAHKIRFIFFDDTTRADYTSTERNTALSEMVSGTPEGYNMVILSHHPLSQSLTDSHWQNPVYADDILTPYASRIICCICGHSHADISETQNGILYIATTLAMYGYDQNAQRGTLNTETETAFDTFVIDQANKHIYALRYGHGENRDWTYTLT